MLNELDRYERQILTILQQDATRTTTEIAEQIGLSQAPCWRRIQRLREAGYIKTQVCLLDRHKIGLNMLVFVEVKLTGVGRTNLAEFEDTIRSFPEVLDCFVLMGSVDFMLRVVVPDIEAYEQFFYNKLSRIPGILDANSMVVMSEIKSTTQMPILN